MSNQVKPHQHDHSGLKLSIFFSTLCLIHCIAFPILIVLLSFFSITFHPPLWIEYSLLGATTALGYYSMRHGLNLHHKAWYALVMFTIGIIGAFAIHITWHAHGVNLIKTSLEIFFALLIAVSQVVNYRLTKNYACTTPH